MLPGSMLPETPVLSLLAVARRPHRPKRDVTHLAVCLSASVLLRILLPFSLPSVDQCVCVLTSVFISGPFLPGVCMFHILTLALLLLFQNMTWSPVRSLRSQPTASGRAYSSA